MHAAYFFEECSIGLSVSPSNLAAAASVRSSSPSSEGSRIFRFVTEHTFSVTCDAELWLWPGREKAFSQSSQLPIHQIPSKATDFADVLVPVTIRGRITHLTSLCLSRLECRRLIRPKLPQACGPGRRGGGGAAGRRALPPAKGGLLPQLRIWLECCTGARWVLYWPRSSGTHLSARS